jgi:flagellar protein FliO/FliZ
MSLLGVELPTPVNFIIAFVFVLLLIGAAAWLVRRFGTTAIDAAARGRQPRLAVVDSAAVDGRRKLVIIRRDNVEHLLMIGGPSDVVVETNLIRSTAVATRDTPATRNGSAETPPRAAALTDPTPWPLQPEPVPLQQSVRNARAAADDIWDSPAESAAAPVPDVRPVRPADTLAGLADEIARPAAELTAIRGGQAPAVAPQGAQVQPLRPTPPTLPAAGTVPNPAADQSLAEMAQRLEAALRRPMAGKVTTETQRVTATVEVKAAAPKNAPQAKPQSGNLEQEMASLLSRPGKT